MKQKLNCDLTVVYTSLDTLTEYPNNPRQHDAKQITKIQHSIEEFGFVNPILVDEHNEIIAGHARLEAARLAHLQQVPVIHWSICPRHRKRPIVLLIINSLNWEHGA